MRHVAMVLSAGEVFTVVSFLGRVFPNDTHYPLPYGMHPFSFGAINIDDHVLKDRHDLSVYQQNYRYHCMKNEPETTFNTWTDQTILRGGGEAAAGGCIDDDALAAERASAYGVSIGGCAEGKSMGLCQFPEGRRCARRPAARVAARSRSMCRNLPRSGLRCSWWWGAGWASRAQAADNRGRSCGRRRRTS